MLDFLHHLFLPRESNNHRAKIFHHNSLLLLVIALLLVQLGITSVQTHTQGVLGVSADISTADLLSLTNTVRTQHGLNPVTMNSQLANAASAKGADMFAKNYWAHNSPDGLTPWVFIKQANYDYLYAGENLARGFSSAQSVMDAWMASPGHRENILSPHYTDIGFAVLSGKLTGDDTVLVVEEFGSRNQAVADTTTDQVPTTQLVLNTTQQASSPAVPVITSVPVVHAPQRLVAAAVNKPLINEKSMTRSIAVTILVLFIGLLITDVVIIERKRIVRMFTHNLDHIIYFTILLIIIFIIGRGVIL